jgi:hypothetical protein
MAPHSSASSTTECRGSEGGTNDTTPPQAAAAPGRRGSECCRHHSLLRGQQQHSPAGHRFRGCPPPSPLPGPTDVMDSGRARKVDTPTSHHARSQSSPGHGNLHTSPQQTASSITPRLAPGLSGSCCPTPPSATAAEAPRPQSPSTSPGVSVNSTPTTGSSTKLYGRAPVTPHVLPSPRPPHRMTISLLAMPSIHAAAI